MQIETKFNVGDEVYERSTIEDRLELREYDRQTIQAIDALVRQDGSVVVKCDVRSHPESHRKFVDEDNLVASAEAKSHLLAFLAERMKAVAG